jgi:hypothetical protein
LCNRSDLRIWSAENRPPEMVFPVVMALPPEPVNGVITSVVPPPPFCPFAFPVNVDFIFTRSVSRSAPNRCSRFSVRSGDFLAMLLDGSWREASAIGVTKRERRGHSVCDRDSGCVRCAALTVGELMEVAAETKPPSGA